MHWFQLYFCCFMNSDLRMQAFQFIHCLTSLPSPDQLYPTGPPTPFTPPSLLPFTLFCPTFLSTPAPQAFFLLLFYWEQGGWSPLTEAFPSLPPTLRLGSTLVVCQLAFNKRRRRRSLKRRYRKREEQHLYYRPWHMECLHISCCSLGFVINLTLIILIGFLSI